MRGCHSPKGQEERSIGVCCAVAFVEAGQGYDPVQHSPRMNMDGQTGMRTEDCLGAEGRVPSTVLQYC